MYMVGMNPPALPHELHLSNVGERDPMSSVVKTKYSNSGLNKSNIVSGLWDLGLMHPLVYFIYSVLTYHYTSTTSLVSL